VFEEAPDSAGDEALRPSCGFSLCLALSGSAGHVVVGDRIAALPGEGNDVEGPVALAVASWAEPVSVLVLAGGDFDRAVPPSRAYAAWL
jgi:hypothetical protein